MKTGDGVNPPTRGWTSGRPKASRGAGLRQEAGQALLETALLIPALLMILVGVIELGRLAYFSIETSNAAHAGAQYGAQSATSAVDNSGMQQAALSDGADVPGLSATASSFCTCSGGTGTVTCALSSCTAPARLVQWVKVSTSATEAPLLHYPGLPSSFALTGQAIMRVEQ
ncbi:MAG TPA: TadE/TadG family type IV pilus assembly protein [Terriglobia bacterium]|nr:TadE/TadG family type IV pilus assembly protein [Terriglobia bacterium]